MYIQSFAYIRIHYKRLLHAGAKKYNTIVLVCVIFHIAYHTENHYTPAVMDLTRLRIGGYKCRVDGVRLNILNLCFI